jgi:hypothetical protein
MLNTVLKDTSSGKVLHVYGDPSGHPTLVTTDYGRLHGTFASAVATAGNTAVIIATRGNEGITLTDLIVNIDKTNGASATVQVTDADGSGPVLLAVISSDLGTSMAIAFQGNFSTWQSARVEVIAVAAEANVTMGYYRTPEDTTLTFAAWDEKR